MSNDFSEFIAVSGHRGGRSHELIQAEECKKRSHNLCNLHGAEDENDEPLITVNDTKSNGRRITLSFPHSYPIAFSLKKMSDGTTVVVCKPELFPLNSSASGGR